MNNNTVLIVGERLNKLTNADANKRCQVYFGTSHPRSYISANVMGIKCVTGMSCLMRKDVLDQAGGLVAFAQYIAEDYFMAKAIADR